MRRREEEEPVRASARANESPGIRRWLAISMFSIDEFLDQRQTWARREGGGRGDRQGAGADERLAKFGGCRRAAVGT